jgi:hypothetical protein
MAAAVSYEPSFWSKLKQKFSCCQATDKELVKSPEEQNMDTKVKQVEELREFFRELGIYLLMLFCFSLAIWLDSSSVQKYNLAQIFVGKVKPFESPSSVDSFYSMLYSRNSSSGECSGLLCALSSPDTFALGDDAAGNAANRTTSSHYGSVLLGQIRLRQIRVQKKDCSSFYQNLEAADCFPDYAAGAEETSYTKEWAPDFDTSADAGFKWQSSADTGEVRANADALNGLFSNAHVSFCLLQIYPTLGDFGTYPGTRKTRTHHYLLRPSACWFTHHDLLL